MWRTAKADVAGELGIPPQTSQMSQLSFGAIGGPHSCDSRLGIVTMIICQACCWHGDEHDACLPY